MRWVGGVSGWVGGSVGRWVGAKMGFVGCGNAIAFSYILMPTVVVVVVVVVVVSPYNLTLWW